MPIKQKIPPLVQGMSQQAPELRNPSKLDLQINCISDPVHGLGKRPGTEHVQQLAGFVANRETFVHWIERDEDERYIVAVDGSSLRVFDLEGNTYPVLRTDPTAVGYLAAIRPRRSLDALTVSDRTYLSNDQKIVKLLEDTVADVTPQALVWVRAGNYSTEYGVKVDSSTVLFTTHGTGGNASDGTSLTNQDREESIKTSTIADRLANGWTTGQLGGTDPNGLSSTGLDGLSGFSATLEPDGNVILFEKDDGLDFDISTIDSVADSQLQVIKNQADSFADLPPRAPDGYTVHIVGLDGVNDDDYWVRFNADDDSGAISKGYWEETAAPGSRGTLDPETMPRALDRKQDDIEGTVTGVPFGLYFELVQPNWDPRPSGDDETNPAPSFVGGTIDSMFLMANRLSFASGSNIVASRTGDFGQLFKTSALSLTDDDRIDATINVAKAVNVKYAVPQSQEIILIGEVAQVSIPTDEVITPANFRFSNATNLDVDVTARPAVSNRSMFAAFRSTQFSGVREHSATGISGLEDATEVTLDNPRLIRGRVTQLETADEVSTLFIRSDGTPQRIYVYRWLNNGQNRIQSSLSYWTIGGDVLSLKVYDGYLWMIVSRPDGVTLEKMALDAMATQDSQLLPFRLDRFTSLNAPPAANSDVVVDDGGTMGDGGTDVGGATGTGGISGGGGGFGGSGLGIGDALGEPGGSTSSTTSGGITTPTSAVVELSIPYAAPSDLVVLDARRGVRIPYELVSGDPTRVLLPSYAASTSIIVGVPYRASGILGQTLRRIQTGQGLSAATSGRLQVYRYWVTFNQSGPFFVYPIWKNSVGTLTEVARIHTVGSDITVADYQDGVEDIPIYEESSNHRLGFLSDSYWPFWITSAEWEGEFFQNAQQI